MDRRGFLKSIGKVVGGLAVAPSVVIAKKPDEFRKVKHLRDIKGKGMSKKEFDALGLPEMKPIEQLPQCSCPAPYIADVTKKPVPHFDYCKRREKVYLHSPKLYANFYNSKGEIVACEMPIREVNSQCKVFKPIMEKGCYTILVCDETGVLWMEKMWV